MFKRTRFQSSLNSNINVTPMADVMLVLLIIFMIATPMLQKNVSVNLPKTQNPLDAKPPEPFTLSLTRDGHMYLGKIEVTEQKMMQLLSERFEGDANKILFIRADQALAYGKVVHIVNECRRSGAQHVGLMTEKEVH
jgi:biopolymer transport protein TolR